MLVSTREKYRMKSKPEVLQGTLDLMVLKTLDAMGPMHGYGIAQRIQQISQDVLYLNQGTLSPRYCVWNSAAGSAPSGAFRIITAKPSITR
jgi:hypothetical protein